MRVKLILKLVALWLLFCVRTGSHCSKGVSRYSYTAYKNVGRVLLLFDLNSLVPFPLQCINFFKPMPYWPCQIFLFFFSLWLQKFTLSEKAIPGGFTESSALPDFKKVCETISFLSQWPSLHACCSSCFPVGTLETTHSLILCVILDLYKVLYFGTLDFCNLCSLQVFLFL